MPVNAPFVSLGEVHTVFSELLAQAALVAGNNANAAQGTAQRMWDDPPGAWANGPYDFAAILAAFDTTEITDNYKSVMTSTPPGSSGDATSLRLQKSYVDSARNAFLTRHVSPVRAACHAAARLQGHASSKGVILRGTYNAADIPIKLGVPPV